MVLKIIQDKYPSVIAVYQYGSSIYGYKSPGDIDYIVVVENTETSKPEQFSLPGVDFTIYPKEYFIKQIYRHEISVLECLFLPKERILIEKETFEFNLSLSNLRKAISEKTSNSWVKAKKKLTLEQSYNLPTGKKSLFHSLRILYFAIQIARTGKIEDYSCANYLWQKIEAIDNWVELDKTFRPLYNKLRTEFKLLTPK